MLNLDPDLDGSGCSALSFKGIQTPLPMLPAALPPPDSALIFRCSFLGPDFSQRVPQSEYSSDLGAQKAPFWLPFWNPFWARLQK